MRVFLSRTWKWLLAAVTFSIAGGLFGLQWTSNKDGLTLGTPHGLNELGQKLFFDLAIAVLIAIVVREVVERAYERREEERKKEAESTTLDTIFMAVYGAFFDTDLIKEARDAIFAHRLVRKDFAMEYKLTNHPKSSRLIYMDVQMKYEVSNVSKFDDKFEPVLMLGNAMARFPNDPLREGPTLIKLEVGSWSFTSSEISDLNRQIDPSIVQPRLSLGTYELPAGQSLTFLSQIRIIKLANDAETMRMIMPTKNVSISVVNHMRPNSIVEVAPIHAKPFLDPDESIDPLRWTRRSPNLFLPNNGWVIYWNDLSRNLSDGQSVPAPNLERTP